MIRVSVTASDLFLVDSIASTLTQEIATDVLQLTYWLSRNSCESIRDHRSVLIVIDDGGPDAGSLQAPDIYRENGPLLLIRASLKAINLHVDQSYQLSSPRMEQATKLVRDFSRTYLRKMHQEVVAEPPFLSISEQSLTWPSKESFFPLITTSYLDTREDK